VVTQLAEFQVSDVFVEARVFGQAYYESALTPRPAGWLNENFDSLGVFLQAVHEVTPEMRVHAVVDVLRVYSDLNPFAPPAGHLLLEHPGWLCLDRAGQRRDLAGNLWIDPGVPGVRTYLESVVRELAERYELNGIHLSELRYPGTDMHWGYNPQALAAFQAGHPGAGRELPGPAEEEWVAWRAARLTDLATALAETARKTRPGMIVSVAALATGQPPRFVPSALMMDGGSTETTPGVSVSLGTSEPDFRGALQNWPAWRRRGLFDWVALSNRHSQLGDERTFLYWVDYARSQKGSGQILAEVSGAENVESGVVRLMRLAMARGCDGVLLDSYQTLGRERAALPALAYISRATFSPDAKMPLYLHRALLASVPPPATDFRMLEIPEGPSTPREEAIVAPAAVEPSLTQTDATRALLGLSRSVSFAGARPAPGVEGPADLSLFPEPSPRLFTEGGGWQRVQLSSGRDFIGQQLASQAGLTTFRLRDGLIVALPDDQVASMSPLEEAK